MSAALTPEAAATVDAITREDESKGAPVHSFNPDATSKEKAAIAGQAEGKLKPLSVQTEARAVDIDTSGIGAPVPPTITIQDVDQIAKEDSSIPDTTPPQLLPPGALPVAPAPTIPDWYRIGWKQVAGITDGPVETNEETIAKSTLDAFLPELYYGQWFHNAGIIVFAVLSTHIVTRLRFGFGSVVIILAACTTYYKTSIQRVRRYARDDIQRELIKTRLATEHESADWMNNFLDRFWLIYEPVLSRTIVSSVELVLAASTPNFLDSLKLSKFTLGTKAPRIDKVRTFPRTENDVVLMDWSIKFTPSDLSDVTPRQQSAQVNPKIILEVRLGKGLATAAIPILVEDINFVGHMRIKLKLMNNFPHVQLVELSFLEKPVIDFVLKPIGGETFGWDIGNIPGLSSFIDETIHSILQPMMYDPNVYTLNLEQMLSGTPLDAANGVLQVTVSSAHNLKGSRIGGGTPDPYVSLAINNRTPLAKTKFKDSTYDPHWGSTHFILLNDSNMNETLTLSVLDHNEHRKDFEIGVASFELQSLLADAAQEDISREVLKDGKAKGEIKFDISFYPVLKPVIVDGKAEPLPDTDAGICRLILHGAKDLDSSRTMSGDLNPFAKLFISSATNSTPHHVTRASKHTNSPVWESPTEFLVPNKHNSVISIKIIDDRDFLKDPLVGYVVVSLEDILEATHKRKTTGQDPWFSLSGCKSGQVKISAEWKPLSMAGSLHGSGSYVPPIGLVKVWIKNAKDVKNVEAGLGGKSDPYVRVLLNGTVEARTDVVNNNLNPEWDQIVYVPVHSLRETMVLECMDYQNLTKDRSLGRVNVSVAELATDAETGSDPGVAPLEYTYSSKGKVSTTAPIQVEKGVYKGTLTYEAEFFPSLNLAGLSFDGETNELEKAVGSGSGDDESETPSADEGSISSSDEENERIPQGVTIKSIRRHTKNATSRDTTMTSATVSTSPTDFNDSSLAKKSVSRTKEELLKSQSGIIIFRVIAGQLAKKSRLEVLIDESYWPVFSTDRAISSGNAKWDEVGEGFIKEMDFGRICLRLNENDEGEKEDIIGSFNCDAKAFLEKCMGNAAEFELTTDDRRYVSKVSISAKFVPVAINLEPRESVNDMGTLRVELIDGKDLHGADRSGKSDPFVVFSLNGSRAFKSETKKKTVAPVWNEDFTVTVPSRVQASFNLEVFDWNQIEQAKSLGLATIELADLEPFQSVERTVSLASSKHGEKGSIRIRLLFQPAFIMKSRKNTSTFSAAGRAMTQMGGLPLDAGKGVFQGVGSVSKLAKGVFTGRKEKSSDEATLHDGTPSLQLTSPSNTVLATASGASALASGVNNGANGGLSRTPQTGLLKFVALGAKDLSLHGESSVKPYLSVRSGVDEHKTKHAGKTLTPEWNETFTFSVGPELRTLHAAIYDHKTLGRDKNLGEVEIDIWRHLSSTQQAQQDLWLDLKDGNGSLHVRLEFVETANTTGRKSPTLSTSRAGLTSPSRFSISKRTADE